MNWRTPFSILLFLVATAASADLVFSAPPREDPAEALKLYAPLIETLSRATGEKISFVPAKNWAAYGEEMRAGNYDLVIDGPHFVAWRIAHLKHVPIVRFQGKLNFTIFAPKDGASSLKDLRFRKVCTMSSPNLGAVVLLTQFDPYSAPELVAPRSGVKGTWQAYQDGRCVAVVLPSFFIQRLPPEKLASMKQLFTSPEVPNLALTASPRVSPEKRAAIRDALLDSRVQAGMKETLVTLGGKAEGSLLAARSEEYAGYQQLLEGVVWGW